MADQVYALLKEEIVTVVRQPGDLMGEADLAERYGVSKTPVREALRLLARDGWIVVFCNKQKFWEALLDALELPELATDARFATFPDRFDHKAALLAILKPRFAARTTDEWLRRLQGRVPCAPVNTLEEALADEQVRQREMILEIEHPRFGTLREVASPIKTDGVVARPAPAPALGQHTDTLLGRLLGYPLDRIAGLRAAGVFGPTDQETTAS